MAAMKTRIAEVLERNEAEILADWMKEQATALTQRPDLMKESELRQQSTKFLKLFREAIAGNNLIDIQQPIWGPVREFIGEVSRSRAIQGFSPSETATFVLSLKQPLFTRLRKIHEGQPDYLFEDLWNVTVLLDKLGLYSVEVFQKTREEATRIMLHVHRRGVGVCGAFTYEVAESKVTQVMDLARQNQHPLQCTIEKE